MSNALSLSSGDYGTARIPSVRSASHLSDSGILLTFAARVLIANPCSVTITDSHDEFDNSNECTKTESWVPLSSSCRLGKHVQNLLPKFQNLCVVPSSMQSVCRRLALAADVASVQQMRGELHQPTVSLNRTPMRYSNAAFSVLA